MFSSLSLSLSLSLSYLMASLQSLPFSSPVSKYSRQPLQQRRNYSGLKSSPLHPSVSSAFHGQALRLSRSQRASLKENMKTSRPVVMMVKPKIQFIQGTDERTIPDVRLTKSRDGTNGVAIFRFEQPSVFDQSGDVGEITGFYMIDEEGVLQSVDVNAKFVNGKPAGIEAKYIMRSPREWDRFMRFMERYSNANGLQFIKK